MSRRTARTLSLASLLLGSLLLGGLLAVPAHAQGTAPHAWLFGVWTGGLFPTSGTVTAQVCLAQPTVIFTRDVVLRATLTEVSYDQRIIETARTTAGVTDFRFAPSQDPVAATGNGLLGMQPPRNAAGFGCESDDVLHVQRRSENEIVFPGCADFPNPLVRCPAR